MRQEASGTHSDSRPDHGLLALASRQSGFTLIEIMLVLVIIAILLAIATATFLNQSGKAHAITIETDLTNAAHSATYTFTSYGKGVFPTNTITQLAHSEPELNITCGDTYVKGQVSAYFKDTSDCTPANGAHVLDLRGVSEDGTYYVEQLNYTSKQRKILRLKGDADSTTNYATDPSFDPNSTGDKIAGYGTLGASTHLHALADPGATDTYAGQVDCIAQSPPTGCGFYVGLSPTRLAVTPGQVVFSSIRALASTCVNTPILRLEWYNSSNVRLATAVGTGTSLTATVPAGVAKATMTYYSTPAPTDCSFKVDDWMVTIGSTSDIPYFDGSYPDAVWNGTAYDSTSIGYAWQAW